MADCWCLSLVPVKCSEILVICDSQSGLCTPFSKSSGSCVCRLCWSKTGHHLQSD